MSLFNNKKRKFDEIEEINNHNISYTIIWFDNNIDKIKQDSIIRGRLRSFLEYIEKFNNNSQFKQFIQNVQDKIIYIILPIKFVSLVLSNLHDSSKSYRIYIYKEIETDYLSTVKTFLFLIIDFFKIFYSHLGYI